MTRVIWIGPFPVPHNGISEYCERLRAAWREPPAFEPLTLHFDGWSRSYARQTARVARALTAASRDPDPPLVHLQYCPFSAGPASLVVAAQARALGLRLVTTVHEERAAVTSVRTRGMWKLYPAVERTLLQWSDALVVQSEGQRDRLPAAFRGKATVIELAADVCAACQTEPALDAPVVGCFGLIKPHKGIDITIAACADVVRQLPALQLRIIGDVQGAARDQAYAKWLRMRARELLGHRARFVTGLPAAGFDAEYHNVAVASFTLRQATQSTTLYRAFSHARPVIVTDVGGVAEVTRREGLGEVVPPDDVAATASAMVRLLRDREAYTARRDAIRRYIAGRGPQAIVEEHRRLYASLARPGYPAVALTPAAARASAMLRSEEG